MSVAPVHRKERPTYTFQYLSECPMCGAPFPTESKVLGKRLSSSQGLSPRSRIGICVTVVRCKSCGLITANPLPIPADLRDHYDVPPESYWTEVKSLELTEGYFKEELSTLYRLLSHSKKNLRALDVGSGIGRLFYVLEKEGFETWGVEPSPAFRNRAIELGLASPDRLLLAPVEEVEFPSEYFDFITFSAVFEHLYYPGEVLKKVLGWLKPDGIIHIEVPSANWLIAKLLDVYYRLIGTDYTTHLSPMHPPYHLYEFTPQSFIKNGKLLGYEVLHKEIKPGHLKFLAPIIRVMRPYMRLTRTDMQLVVWLKKKI